MRFKTRYDRWLVAVVVVAFAVSCGSVLRRGPDWIALLPIAIWAPILLHMLPQYYETRPDGLFIRQGWRRILIPYPSLIQVESWADSRSAPVFSMQRIKVVTREDKEYVIAVAEEERFFAMLASLCPQLKPSPGGLRLPHLQSMVS